VAVSLAGLAAAPGCGGDQTVDPDAARLAAIEQEARERKDDGAPPLRPLDTPILNAHPAGEGCTAHESMTILLDGDQIADPHYHSDGQQPSVVIGLTDHDGVSGVLVEDLGDYAPAMDYNLDAWLTRWRIEETTYPRRALLISHPHTIGRMILPGKITQPVEEGPAVIDETLRRLGHASLTSPNFQNLCDEARRDPNWPVAPVCERPVHDLETGLEPLVWGDGTKSGRVFLYTYAIAPEELDKIPFQPLETVLIVQADPGYLVYSVCSHLPNHPDEGHVAPFHVAYEIKALMDAGKLEPGPIHTVVTGTCGVLRTFDMQGGKTEQGVFDTPGFQSRVQQMRDDLGIQRLFLSHCALRRTSQHSLRPFYEVFREGVQLAYPGACIPLSPPAAVPQAEAPTDHPAH